MVMCMIVGLPKVMLSPASPHHVRVGQRVVIECVAEGDPMPTVYWEAPQRIGVGATPRGESHGSAVLEIGSVTDADQGTYVCVADNGQGRTEGVIQLISKSHMYLYCKNVRDQ